MFVCIWLTGGLVNAQNTKEESYLRKQYTVLDTFGHFWYFVKAIIAI